MYKTRRAADAKFRVQDDAELAILDAIRDDDVKRFIVSSRGDKEILLEIEQGLPEGADIKTAVNSHDFQTVIIKRHQGKNVQISRTIPKKISREKISRLAVIKLND